MEKLINEILDIAEEINKKYLQKKIDDKEFAEQKENIDALKEECEQVLSILNELKQSDLQDKDWFDEKIIYLAVYFKNILGNFYQWEELLKTIAEESL